VSATVPVTVASTLMFEGVGAGNLSAALDAQSKHEGPSITPPREMAVLPSACTNLEGVLRPVNPVVSIVNAPLKLLKQLNIMREELVEKVDVSQAEELMSGMQFDEFHENACAVRFIGVRLYDMQFPEGDRRREPYKKIVEDLCEQYALPDDVKNNMLNGELAKEMHQVNFEFKFTKGQPGNFYFGKFMAMNTNSEVDMVMLFYRLGFKLSPKIIASTYAQKFLWFTVGTRTEYTKEEKNLTEKDTDTFKNHFRLKMYAELSDQIKAFALEDD